MARHVRSDRDQTVYRTYDGRLVTREAIDMALLQVGARQRDPDEHGPIRVWLLVVLTVLLVAAVSIALIWWRFTLPL